MATGSVRKWLGRPEIWAGLWIAWFITLWILSSMRQPGPHVDMIGFDKIMHTAWFAGGGVCLALARFLRRGEGRPAPAWGRIFLTVLLTGALVGWLDEWHQSHTPGRQGLDVYDWLADILGSMLAVPAARFLSGFLRPR